MELRVLKYFLAVAREHSFVKAAQSLHLSQPTVSTQIMALEEELGKPLLIRGTKGSRKVMLTEEGQILQRRADEILALVEKTEKEITASSDTIVGDVYIGAGETQAVRWLARAIHNVQEKYPEVRCHILSGNAEFIQEKIDNGLLDFGLVFDIARFPGCEKIKIPWTDTWGVLMRKDSPFAQCEGITAENLCHMPLILSEEEDLDALATWTGKKNLMLNVVATYNLLFNASILVKEQVGYAICLADIIEYPETSPLCFRALSPPRSASMYMVRKKAAAHSKAAEKLFKEVKALTFIADPHLTK